MSNDGTPIHLRPIEAEIVNGLCERALDLAGTSWVIRMEVDGFRRDRTPWDARRLARALAIDHVHDPLTKELYNLAYFRAGLYSDLDPPTRQMTQEEIAALDVCPAHPDGVHRFTIAAMTSKEMLASDNVAVQLSVIPPMGCACGMVRASVGSF